MSLSNRWLRRLRNITLMTLGVALSCATVMAQAPPTTTGPGTPASGAPAGGAKSRPETSAAAAAEAEATAARYRIPETKDPKALMSFLNHLREFQPRDTQSYLIHRQQLPRVTKAVSERILLLEPDKMSPLHQQAALLVLVAQVQMLADLNPAEQRELYLQINKRLAVSEPPQTDFILAMQFATRLETTPNTALAAEVYGNFAKIFAANGNPDIVDMSEAFTAAARRLNLLGKPMEVFGQTIDGKPFNWKAYQGKVVLVDYWFAGCEPCRRELPNVKRMYQLYHDRGFEVVGINVDDRREEAEALLKAEGVPWVTLFDTGPSGDHPMSEYYGVISFPTILLVGKDGKVVSLEARGEKLQELLFRLLGPAGDNQPNGTKNARTPGNRGS